MTGLNLHVKDVAALSCERPPGGPTMNVLPSAPPVPLAAHARPRTVTRLLFTLLLTLGLSACRTAAPERVALGACLFAAGQHLGSLPFWEGPSQEIAGDLAIAPRSLVVTSSRGFQTMAAEVYADGARLALVARTYRGSASVLATDGRGQSILFVRPVTQVGGDERFDLEHDTLAVANLRKGGALAMLPQSAWQPGAGGSMTRLCAGSTPASGGIWAWVDNAAGPGATPRQVLGPVHTATLPPVSPVIERAVPFRCASDDVCDSMLFSQSTGPDEIQTRCNETAAAPPPREPAGYHWMSSSVLHPRGTVADFESTHRHSTLRVRLRGDLARTFALPGVVYAVTFRDERTLLAHVVEGAANQPGHVGVVVVDAARGPVGRMDLDFARGPIDKKGHPDVVLLPEKGNGRPLLVPLESALVLITGPGDVWAWRQDGDRTCGPSSVVP